MKSRTKRVKWHDCLCQVATRNEISLIREGNINEDVQQTEIHSHHFKNHKLKFAALLMAFSFVSFALPLTAPFMIQYIIGEIERGMGVTPWMIFMLILATLLMLTLDYLINVYGNVMCANLIYRGSADLYQDLFALPYGEREAKYDDKNLLQNITAFTDSALSLWVMIISFVISVIVTVVLLILSIRVHFSVSFFILAHIGITIFAGKSWGIYPKNMPPSSRALKPKKIKISRSLCIKRILSIGTAWRA